MSAEMHLDYVPTEEVLEYPGNPRTHSKPQSEQFARSIAEFGFIVPIVVDGSNTIIAGHGRILAARDLGLEVIPIIRAAHLTPDQVRAYRIADNKLAENSAWDDELLRVEIEYLTGPEIEFAADLTGFSTPEIDLLLHADLEHELEEELVPPPDPADAVSQEGDIWYLDNHRVIVGDCRDVDTVDRVMNGELANAAICDAPYNCQISGFVSGLGKHKHREFAHASGEMTDEEFTSFLVGAMQQVYRVCADGSIHFWFSDWRSAHEFLQAGKATYDRMFNCAVLAKSNAGMGSLYRSQHEFCWIFKKGSIPHTNNVELGRHGRNRTNLWSYPGANSFGPDRDGALARHPTPKNVKMLTDALLDVTAPKDVVVDFFLGSGSTLLAAERTHRTCYGIEIDPIYVDVTIERWERQTGLQAVLADTGQTFEQVAADRRAGKEVTS